MRILHTSDWHLGQHFMGKTRQDEHQALVGWLVAQVIEHQVDAVLITGDIFDIGAPPSYAREIYNDLIIRLHDTGTQVVVLAGNHDSVATLSESRGLLARFGVHVVPAVAATPEEQVLVLNDRAGVPAALLLAAPFIRPRDLVESLADQSADDKKRALQNAIHAHYERLHAAARAYGHRHGTALPIVATGHLTAVGFHASEAATSESVRDIYVGTLDAFPAALFPAVDYVALGHIHRPQKVGGTEHIRYSGSPIPLSFDEASQGKEMLLVDLDASGLKAITPLVVPSTQPLASITGALSEIAAALVVAARAALPGRPVWLEITVRDDDYLADLQPRVLAMAEGLPVEVLRVKRERGKATPQLTAAAHLTLDDLTPDEVFHKRLEQEAIEPALARELARRYRAIVEQLGAGG